MKEVETMEKIYEVNVGNYYGCLNVKVVDGQYYWCVENWDGKHWEPISAELGAVLVKNAEDITEREY